MRCRVRQLPVGAYQGQSDGINQRRRLSPAWVPRSGFGWQLPLNFVGESDWDFSIWTHNACEFQVGTYQDLTNEDDVGDGLDAHHAPQAHPAELLDKTVRDLKDRGVPPQALQELQDMWRDLGWLH